MEGEIFLKMENFAYKLHEISEKIYNYLGVVDKAKEIVDTNKFKEKLQSFANEIKTSSEEIIKFLSE